MDYKNGIITKEEFIQYKDELEKQKAELNQRILQLQAKDLEAGETDSKLEQAMEIKEYRRFFYVCFCDKILKRICCRCSRLGRRHIINPRNNLQREYPLNLLLDIITDQIENPGFDLENLSDDQIDGLRYALSTLKPREQLIVACRYEDYMTMREIGERFGVSNTRIG